jgi:hypothetical protein
VVQAKLAPRTLENTRVFDETVVDPNDAEVANDVQSDELAAYFQGLPPKVLITTSNRPSTVEIATGPSTPVLLLRSFASHGIGTHGSVARLGQETHAFAELLANVIPTGDYFRRRVSLAMPARFLQCVPSRGALNLAGPRRALNSRKLSSRPKRTASPMLLWCTRTGSSPRGSSSPTFLTGPQPTSS